MKKTTTSTKTSFTPKPPVVAVLGHVDHGKTTLLDTLRKSRIAQGEAGAITQHIGAYQVDHKGSKITFIDTPGHEAFTNLRSRGARTADIALLVIDAAESVKPQTVESIKIIKEANIPMIVALNKMDLPHANPKKVSRDLLRYDVQLEEQGGKVASVPISAKEGTGINDLLDSIVLVSELKQFHASEHGVLHGVVIESRKDKGRGLVATVIVQNGTLEAGETIVCGDDTFRVRALFDDRGKSVKKAPPATPVEVLGLHKLPKAGTKIFRSSEKSESEKGEASNIPEEKQSNQTEEAVLKLLLKADTQGSLEAIISQLPSEVEVVSTDVGDIVETDIMYAKTIGLVIIGFNVSASSAVQKRAQDEGVRIRTYRIIYKLLEEIEEVVELLKKGPQRKIIGEAKILQVFDTSDGQVAGCQVTEGRIARGDKVTIKRNDEEIAESVKVNAIRQQKETVNKVEKGKLCGLLLSPQIDFRVGDMIQSYILYEF